MRELKRIQRDPVAFRSRLMIEPGVRFGDVISDFQARDFSTMDPAWISLTGRKVRDVPYRYAFIERLRGSSKSTDAAISAAYVLFASLRRLRGTIAAVDREQASLILDAVGKLLSLNPFLKDYLSIRTDKIFNPHTESMVKVISGDSWSSFGLLVDFVLFDEVSHLRDSSLWESLVSASAKREQCVFVSMCNAGWQDHWLWKVREKIRQSSSWYFSRQDPVTERPSWLSAEKLEEQRQILPSPTYRRLFENTWIESSGDALEVSDIEAAFSGTSTTPDGWQVVCGIDIGLKRDRSAVVICGKHTGTSEEIVHEPKLSDRQRAMIDLGLLEAPEVEYEFIETPSTGRYRVFDLFEWQGSKDRPVSLEAVERVLLDIHRQYPGAVFGYDPHQSQYLAQRCAKAGLAMLEVPFTAKNLVSMCSQTLTIFNQRRIDLPEHESLKRDLQALRVKEMTYGCRLDADRSAAGHADLGTSLGICLHMLAQPYQVHDGPLIVY